MQENTDNDNQKERHKFQGDSSLTTVTEKILTKVQCLPIQSTVPSLHFSKRRLLHNRNTPRYSTTVLCTPPYIEVRSHSPELSRTTQVVRAAFEHLIVSIVVVHS
jgi:hypothetical protein